MGRLDSIVSRRERYQVLDDEQTSDTETGRTVGANDYERSSRN